MLGRLLLGFVAFLYSINFVSAGIFDPLIRILGEEGLYGFLNSSPEAVLGLYAVCVFIAFYTLMKVVLKPVFGGHPKETNVIAGAISVIGTTGLFYNYLQGSGGVEGAIVIIGGTVGSIFLLFVSLLFLKGIDNLMMNGFHRERFDPIWWLGILLSFIVISIPLIANLISIFGSEEQVFVATLMTMQGFAILGLIAVILIVVGGKKLGLRGPSISGAGRGIGNRAKGFFANENSGGKWSKESVAKNKEVQEAKDLIDKIHTDAQEARKMMYDIKTKTGGAYHQQNGGQN